MRLGLLTTRLNGRPAVKANIIKLENQADYILDTMPGVRNKAIEALLLVVLVLVPVFYTMVGSHTGHDRCGCAVWRSER